ncbi:MAG TPA: MqnA/MqnD/SBP family protein [Chthonomonadales bacterium]|nr:MqnA/MqnD/SBP family protein [Chthonomonadales bacterium]
MQTQPIARHSDTLIRLGHSPDSDDAFMFYGLASGKVEAPGVRFRHILRDIQTLNDWARDGLLECTAISVHAYSYVAERYAILTHGASMGDGYGPIVVARDPMIPEQLANVRIAVPGLLTSAFLALSLYLPHEFQYAVVPFDKIMEAVRDGEADAGLVIHEGQLTHMSMGLYNLVDLGKWWKDETGLPLPLGVNGIRKDLDPELQVEVSKALRNSILYGLEHRATALRHALSFARDMDEETADSFVGMYVNNWTVEMGEAGRRSIELFLQRGAERKLCPSLEAIQFVE